MEATSNPNHIHNGRQYQSAEGARLAACADAAEASRAYYRRYAVMTREERAEERARSSRELAYYS